MTIDVDFHLDQGVRLSAARRGPRLPIGPPVARIEDEGASPDPVSVWFGELSGGGRRTPATQMPGAGRRDRFVDVEAHLEYLTSLHLVTIDGAEAPTVTRAGPSSLGGRARPGDDRPSRPVRRLQRLFSRVAPGRDTPSEIVGSGRWDETKRQELQAQADLWWDRLCGNDPETVRQRLEQAFAAHGFGAAVAAIHDDVGSLVLNAAPAEVLVGRWQRSSAGGRLHRMSRPERHRLHAEIIAAAVVALAADALAVAPGLGEVRCGVLQADHPQGTPAVLGLARLSRRTALPEKATERREHDLLAGATADGSLLHLAPNDSDGMLAPLDRDHPVIKRLLDALEPAH